jgi:hypothetical protein
MVRHIHNNYAKKKNSIKYFPSDNIVAKDPIANTHISLSCFLYFNFDELPLVKKKFR